MLIALAPVQIVLGNKCTFNSPQAKRPALIMNFLPTLSDLDTKVMYMCLASTAIQNIVVNTK